MSNMIQEDSSGKPNARTACGGTESIIHQAFLNASTKRVALHPSFLDDEKLSESERVAALEEIFHCNIRSRQIESLARHMAPALGEGLPANLLIYGASGAGRKLALSYRWIFATYET